MNEDVMSHFDRWNGDHFPPLGMEKSKLPSKNPKVNNTALSRPRRCLRSTLLSQHINFETCPGAEEQRELALFL